MKKVAPERKKVVFAVLTRAAALEKLSRVLMDEENVNCGPIVDLSRKLLGVLEKNGS